MRGCLSGTNQVVYRTFEFQSDTIMQVITYVLKCFLDLRGGDFFLVEGQFELIVTALLA